MIRPRRARVRAAGPPARPTRARASVLVAASWLVGCAGAEPRTLPPPAVDATVPLEASEPDAGLDLDGGGPDLGPPGPADAGPSACALGEDGTLGTEQLQFAVGATVLYVQNRDGTTVDGVDTAGVVEGDSRRWDFSEERPEDHRILDELVSPAGQWWRARYPDATYTAALDRGQDVWGVFRASPGKLELLGVVSGEALRTDLRMSPPVEVLRTPMRPGERWQQRVTGAGTLDWVAVTNVTDYRFEVDARGEVRTPAARFDVLRLRTELEQSVPLTIFSRSQRSYTFLAPCWGVVARVASTDGETALEFTRASEYRRLGL